MRHIVLSHIQVSPEKKINNKTRGVPCFLRFCRAKYKACPIPLFFMVAYIQLSQIMPLWKDGQVLEFHGTCLFLLFFSFLVMREKKKIVGSIR